jgi:peroxiredoxin-like protein
MENHYIYSVSASSTTVRSGIVSADETEPSIAFSAPPEFQGEPGNWTPEHFLLAAVAGCFVSTFSGMAHFSKFAFLSLEVSVEGNIQKDQGGWRFTQVNVRPRLKISQENDRERASRLLEKAEKTCLVVRSLACQVALEPEILVEEEMMERQNAGNSIPIT